MGLALGAVDWIGVVFLFTFGKILLDEESGFPMDGPGFSAACECRRCLFFHPRGVVQ
jgi:hypothetical protein